MRELCLLLNVSGSGLTLSTFVASLPAEASMSNAVRRRQPRGGALPGLRVVTNSGAAFRATVWGPPQCVGQPPLCPRYVRSSGVRPGPPVPPSQRPLPRVKLFLYDFYGSARLRARCHVD